MTDVSTEGQCWSSNDKEYVAKMRAKSIEDLSRPLYKKLSVGTYCGDLNELVRRGKLMEELLASLQFLLKCHDAKTGIDPPETAWDTVREAAAKAAESRKDNTVREFRCSHNPFGGGDKVDGTGKEVVWHYFDPDPEKEALQCRNIISKHRYFQFRCTTPDQSFTSGIEENDEEDT